MAHVAHYKRVPLIGLMLWRSFHSARWRSGRRRCLVLVLVLVLLFSIGSGLGTVFPISTVCMQNAVVHAQMGVATGAANFFRALFSALVVAILGAIVLGGLGGATGMSVRNIGARCLASRTRLCVPIRVPVRCAGACLRHGVFDCTGRAAVAWSALRAAISSRHRADRTGDTDSCGMISTHRCVTLFIKFNDRNMP